jgi:hypothetical protein
MIDHLIDPLFYLLLGNSALNEAVGGSDKLKVFQRGTAEKLHRLFRPIALLPDWEEWTPRFVRAGQRLSRSGVIEWIEPPDASDSGSIGTWRIPQAAWSKYGYMLWTIRALLESVQSALSVSAMLPEEGLEDDKFSWRVRNGAVQAVTTSMLGWAREFLIDEGVLQKIVMDRDGAGPRITGVVSNDRQIGQDLFQLLRLILISSRGQQLPPNSQPPSPQADQQSPDGAK